jgi:16S rRNA (cytosine967-C5)-methyltransferase
VIRGFIAESVYEIVRWWRLLNEVSPSEDLYHLFGTYWVLQGNELPDWREFKGMDPKFIKAKYDRIRERAVLQSIPDWLDDMGAEQLGEKWEKKSKPSIKKQMSSSGSIHSKSPVSN